MRAAFVGTDPRVADLATLAIHLRWPEVTPIVVTSVAEALSEFGHDIIQNNQEHIFGGAQLIYRLSDGYCGGSDHRKEGLVAGF